MKVSTAIIIGIVIAAFGLLVAYGTYDVYKPFSITTGITFVIAGIVIAISLYKFSKPYETPAEAIECLQNDTNMRNCCSPGGFFYGSSTQPHDEKQTCLCLAENCYNFKNNGETIPPICHQYPSNNLEDRYKLCKLQIPIPDKKK